MHSSAYSPFCLQEKANVDLRSTQSLQMIRTLKAASSTSPTDETPPISPENPGGGGGNTSSGPASANPSPPQQRVRPPKPKKQAGAGDCCICSCLSLSNKYCFSRLTHRHLISLGLYSLTVCQALFVAPCSHVFHYKCVHPLVERHYPGFSCPMCRTFADLSAEVDNSEELPTLEQVLKEGDTAVGKGHERKRQLSMTAAALHKAMAGPGGGGGTGTGETTTPPTTTPAPAIKSALKSEPTSPSNTRRGYIPETDAEIADREERRAMLERMEREELEAVLEASRLEFDARPLAPPPAHHQVSYASSDDEYGPHHHRPHHQRRAHQPQPVPTLAHLDLTPPEEPPKRTTHLDVRGRAKSVTTTATTLPSLGPTIRFALGGVDNSSAAAKLGMGLGGGSGEELMTAVNPHPGHSLTGDMTPSSAAARSRTDLGVV